MSSSAVETSMEDTLAETEQQLLMAALVHGLGPKTDLQHVNTARVVNQVLSWRGMSADEINHGWGEPENPLHLEVYEALVRMTHQELPQGTFRPPERPGEALFQGSGNWGAPGDPTCPACWPQFNSCRLTERGRQIAEVLLAGHPEFRKTVSSGPYG